MHLPVHEGKQTGIDTSRWQFDTRYTPILDYQAAANAGIKFAIVRIGVGEHYVDPRFEESVDGWRSVGVKVGGYHVFNPNVNVSPQDQINHMRSIIDGHKLKLLRGDFELPWDRVSSVQQLRDGVFRFLMGLRDSAEATGAFVDEQEGAYTARWWWSTPIGSRIMPKDPPNDDLDNPLIRANGHSLWTADYGANNGHVPARMAIVPVGWRPGDPGTGEHSGWDIWQFTSTGHIDGISGGVGNVDFNLMRDGVFNKVWGETLPDPVPDPIPSDLEERVEELELQVANIKTWGESFPA